MVPQITGLPQWVSGKESACGAGAIGVMGLIPGLGRSPAGGNGNPLQYFFHRQRSLAGYGPWACKVLDTAEWLNMSAMYKKYWTWVRMRTSVSECKAIRRSPLECAAFLLGPGSLCFWIQKQNSANFVFTELEVRKSNSKKCWSICMHVPHPANFYIGI